jgi:hypothetical protein
VNGPPRALLHHGMQLETAAAHAVTLHNITFQARVLGGARDAVLRGAFPAYLRAFFARYFARSGYPAWCVDALRAVGVDLLEGAPDARVVQGGGAAWEYADAAA